jgi:hypothetical protein
MAIAFFDSESPLTNRLSPVSLLPYVATNLEKR